MKGLYLNELAPYERKREYYHNIQLGNQVIEQTQAIKKQTELLVSTQLKTSSSIIASQERINEGIDVLSYEAEKINQGLAGLQAAFEWGISEVVWQIEQTNYLLNNILEVLSAPLTTQAKELKKRALDAYSNGWMDEALEDFLESEKYNRYDFSIHISLGMIYLFHKIDKKKALSYFEKAIKYSRPKSNYHTSYSLLYKALLLRDLGEIEAAEKCSIEAIDLTPELSQAYYQNALYNSLLGKAEKAIIMLEKAITFDTNYCEKSFNEIDFEPVKDNIIKLFEKLRDREEESVRNEFDIFINIYNNLRSIVENNNQLFITGTDSKIRELILKTDKAIHRVQILIKRNSYRDYIEAKKLISNCMDIIPNIVSNAKQKNSEKIKELELMKTYPVKSLKIAAENGIEGLFPLWLVAITIGLILGVRGCYMDGPVKNGSIGDALKALFGIPLKITILSGLILLVLYMAYRLLGTKRNYDPKEVDAEIVKYNEILKQVLNIENAFRQKSGGELV